MKEYFEHCGDRTFVNVIKTLINSSFIVHLHYANFADVNYSNYKNTLAYRNVL